MNEFIPHKGLLADILNWLLSVVEYDEAVLIKNIATDASAILFGILVGVLITAWVVRDANYVTKADADEVQVTRMSKGGRKITFVTVPSKFYPLPWVSTIGLFIQVLIVKLNPKKKFHQVPSRKSRIIVTVFILLIAAVCIFNLALDTTILLPDGTGGYGVYKKFEHK
jgi:hypothetical protein